MGITPVGIERPGAVWRPVHTGLEGRVAVWRPGPALLCWALSRQTDGKDAAWIAQLRRHGLGRPRVIPPRAQRDPRDLRDLTRHRPRFVRARGPPVHRGQKGLEGTTITRASAASAILGLSGRATLAAIAAGEGEAAGLADPARGTLPTQRAEVAAALTGRVRPPHRVLRTGLLVQSAGVEETRARFAAQTAARCAADEPAAVVRRLATIPGVGRATAERPVAQSGTGCPRGVEPLPHGGAPGEWGRAVPGQQRARRVPPGRCPAPAGRGRATPGGARRWWRPPRRRSVVRRRTASFWAQDQRLTARRGAKRALRAGAPALLVCAYVVSRRREPDRERGPADDERGQHAATARNLTPRLRHLGFAVGITPRTQARPQTRPVRGCSG